MKAFSLLTIATLVALAVTGGDARSAGCGKTPTLQSGVQKITVDGKQREYTLRVPPNYNANKQYKLIFALHWRGATMEGAVWVSGGWYGLAARAQESAILVAPNGNDRGWANPGGADVRFIGEIIKTMESRLCVNENQIFATGWSYGASMSHALACALPDKFRAVSLIGGGLASRCDGGDKPVAYQLMHGNNDNVFKPEQGKEILQTFVKANGCDPEDPPFPTSTSGTHITTVFKRCKHGYPVIFTGFDGGHTAEPADSGGMNFAPDETWKFFSQF